MPTPRRRHPIVASLVLASLLPAVAAAQAPAAAPEPDWTFTGNVGLYSQYVFRGVSQTNEKPALQGGFDLGHKSGFYAGTWASNISWISDAEPRASASLEWDLYGGYKGSLPNDFGYDVGVLYYYYPGSYPAHYVKPNTFEVYGALSWKFVSLKYSYSTGDTFGFADSRGSDYIDLTANYDIVVKVSDAIGKVTVTGHVGRQRFKHSGAYDYTDWKAGISTEVWGVTVGMFVSDTNAAKALYTNSFGKKIADTQVVGFVQKTF